MNDQLTNFENYGPYRELVEKGETMVIVTNITKYNYNDHFYGILNILRDGIELREVQSMFITVVFKPGVSCRLTIMDYLFNLLMWHLLIRTKQRIKPKHIFFDDAITKKSIKNYIDGFLIDNMRKSVSNIELNNIIDDTLVKYKHVEEFAMYLANTINLEDTIKLMKACPEFNELMRYDYSNVPIEDVKNVGMEVTNRCIEIIKNSKQYLGYDHCLANSFRAGEAINPRQYKEFANNIGTKPDGRGGVFPTAINNSFITGGVSDVVDYMIESSSGRTAQILSKVNVGSSGHFARLLGLNNQDSFLHPDPNYVCDSVNFEEIEIKSKDHLQNMVNKYYRLYPNGMDHCITRFDYHLIGKKIYLRSPMTCASAARGDGVCYKCYGDLAFSNRDINIGKIAAELLSSKLTQRMLSAKHLLETVINKIIWNQEFFEFFELESNVVTILPDLNTKNMKLIIRPEAIQLESEDEDRSYDEEEGGIAFMESYNEYITEFDVETEEGEIFTVTSENREKLYITNDLNDIIRKKAYPEDGDIIIPMSELKDKETGDSLPIFLIVIMNNDLSKSLDRLKEIIDKNSVTESMDRHQILQAFMDTIIEGNLSINIAHCEVILMNQLRAIDDILEKPQWEYPSETARVISLNKALTNNPSITNSLSYQRIAKALYNPLTFRKHKPSFMDLFFMEQPQEYMNSVDIKPAKKPTDVETNLIEPITFRKVTNDQED